MVRERPDGLEQGFTFKSAPVGKLNGPLTIFLAFSGDLQPVPELTNKRKNLLLTAANGQPELSYSGLDAHDANGRELRYE